MLPIILADVIRKVYILLALKKIAVKKLIPFNKFDVFKGTDGSTRGNT